MTGILNSQENTSLIENASSKLHDKMNKVHREPKDSVSSPGGRAAKTEGMMQP